MTSTVPPRRADTSLDVPDPAAVARALPPDFLWGVATSAHQIEGGARVGGRGASIWDTFAARPGRVRDGHDGDRACDHLHRWREDLELLNWLGVGAYRFSVAWPRWQPQGSGPTSAAGIAFYDRLVDGLLGLGIQPWCTLYHWDLPQALESRGGWGERETAHRFAEYAASVNEVLGDRLTGVITLNEPWCSAFLGYCGGVHAPGVQDDTVAVRAAHHLMLGHGLAMQALRSQDRGAQLGITLNVYPVEPASSAPEDLDAARRIDGLANRIFLDPLLRGEYPQDLVIDLAEVTDFGHVRPGDLDLIHAPLDFLGENYYTPYVVADPQSPAVVGRPDLNGMGNHLPERDLSAVTDGWRPRSPWPGSRELVFLSRGLPRTDMGWEVDPDGLRRVLHRLRTDYDCPPLYITENGSAYPELAGQDPLEDVERTRFIAAHLAACRDAIAEGTDLRGYFLWSLLDNFEWGWGYTRRFGIVRVDFETLRRTPRASARWYRSAVRSEAIPVAGSA